MLTLLKRLLYAALLGSPLALAAQQPAPQLLILGTAHLNNPGRDMNNIAVDDVLTPKRQRDIEEIVNELLRFQPTRIALECAPSKQAEFDDNYAKYRAGSYTLTANERDQIGLRLAARLHLKGVDCVDYQDGGPGPDAAYDFPGYAMANGQGDVLTEMGAAGKALVVEQTAFLQSHPLIDWYRRENQPANLMAYDALYYRYFPRIGGADSHPGANWVGAWHARNMIIVENIRRVTKPNDRVLAIFGSGHAYLLHEYAAGSGAFRIVDTEQYLH